MTENEDLKREIEQLKRELEQLKKEKNEYKSVLKTIQWLEIGKTTVKVCDYVLKTGKAAAESAAAGLPSVSSVASAAGAQSVLFFAPWILLLLYTKK